MSGTPFVWGDKMSMEGSWNVLKSSGASADLERASGAAAGESFSGTAEVIGVDSSSFHAPERGPLEERDQGAALLLGRSRGATLACCCCTVRTCTGLWNRKGPLCPSAAGVTHVTPASGTCFQGAEIFI